MNILVIGNGGREHAMCRALTSGDNPPTLYVAPGNPGTARCGTNVDIGPGDIEGLVRFASDNAIDLVIPGPELPLVLGVVDAMNAAGIPCCGPAKAPALLEGSKAHTRTVADAVNAPSPLFTVVTTEEALERAIAGWDGLPVVKADGLAAGKGVFLPETKAECLAAGKLLLEGSLGDAGRTVVLEERLEGIEVSLFYACNGTDAVALPNARDHKRLLDDDQGPNTGGMGAISPNPIMTPNIEAQVLEDTILPTLRYLDQQGTPFKGFLFAGFMLTAQGPKLLEYNVRLGDPETQAILPRLRKGDFSELCHRVATNRLQDYTLDFDPRPTCTVVMTAAGYPDKPRKGDSLQVDTALESHDRWLIHAGTTTKGDSLVTNGGRVAAIVARAETLESARSAAYEGLEMVQFSGAHARTDIGAPKQEATPHKEI